MRVEEIDLVEIIKRSFKALLHEPGFIGLYLLPYVVFLVGFIYIWFIFGTPTPWAVPQIFPEFISFIKGAIVWIIIGAIVFIILSLIAYAAIILKAGGRARGESKSAGEALREGLRHVPRLFGAGILGALIVAGLFFLCIGLAIYVSPAFILVALLWVLPAIFIGVRLALYAPACVLEDIGCVECLKRSWWVTRGNFWLIFVLTLLLVIISFVLGLIPYIGTLISTLLMGPAGVIAYTLVFLGLRSQAARF